MRDEATASRDAGKAAIYRNFSPSVAKKLKSSAAIDVEEKEVVVIVNLELPEVDSCRNDCADLDNGLGDKSIHVSQEYMRLTKGLCSCDGCLANNSGPCLFQPRKSGMQLKAALAA